MQPGHWFSAVASRPAHRRHSAIAAYWALNPAELATRLESGPDGLTGADAAQRLRDYGPNELRTRRQSSRLDVLVRQMRSPLLLLLVFAAGAAAVTGEWLDAAMVVTIVAATVGIGYSREYRAQADAGALGAATVLP